MHQVLILWKIWKLIFVLISNTIYYHNKSKIYHKKYFAILSDSNFMAIYEIGSDCFDIMYRKLTTTSYQQRRTFKNLQVDIFKG